MLDAHAILAAEVVTIAQGEDEAADRHRRQQAEIEKARAAARRR